MSYPSQSEAYVINRNQPAIDILMGLVNRTRAAKGLPLATAETFRVRNTRKHAEGQDYDSQAEVTVIDDDGQQSDLRLDWTTVYYNRVSILALLGEQPIELPYKPEHLTIAAVLDDLNQAKGTALTSGDIVDAPISKQDFVPSEDRPGTFEVNVTVFCNPTGIVYRGCFVMRLTSETDPYEKFR